MEKNHFAAVAGYVTNSEGSVLMVKSPRRGWEYPGGMVEAGEDIEKALLREIYEESGVTVRINGFVGIYKNLTTDSVILDFRCDYLSGELTTSDESPEVGWFTPDEAELQITNPLTKLRFSQMRRGENIRLVSFRKNPLDSNLEIITDTLLDG